MQWVGRKHDLPAELTAGLEQEIPAVSLDLQCGSALEAVTQAAAKIESGLADLVLAGGMESSSTKPARMWNPNHPELREGQGVDGGAVYTGAAGRAGQRRKGAERTAISGARDKRRTGFLGLWRATIGQQGPCRRAFYRTFRYRWREVGRMKASVPPMSQKLMDRLPHLLPGGCVIHAANACLMYDGAAFVALCSEEYGKRHNLTWRRCCVSDCCGR